MNNCVEHGAGPDVMETHLPFKQGDSEPVQEEELQPPEPADPERVCYVDDSVVDAKKHEKRDSRPRLRVITKTISAPSELIPSALAADEARHPGFGIERGTLELIRVARKEWSQPQSLPLPLAPLKRAPIISEFTRPWSALRLKSHLSDSHPRGRATELPQDQSLLKNYEPRFSVGERTFPSSEVATPSFFDPRVAVEDALALLVTVNLRFALGSIEPLFCRLVIYDVSLGCRVSEEFSFSLPGAVGLNGSVAKMNDAGSASRAPQALFYVLPNHLPQHLYMVLKISKVLSGDGESATAPYCFPEKLTSEGEQLKLVEKAADCRTTMSDEQRLPLIPDAARGAMKEKVAPSVCEFAFEPIEDQRLGDSKFQSSGKNRSMSKNPLPSAPVLEILDPFFSASTERAPPTQSQAVLKDDSATPTETGTSARVADPLPSQCREVQPFCHPSVTSVFGLTGSGPVAVSYVNVLYLYPIHLEKFQFRNIAIRVQVLEAEVAAVCGLDDTDAPSSVLKAIYGADHEACASGYTFVNYHQKNPQFENELKICLPECLTLEHHVLFSFYHVHCKKLLPNQSQQELVGYAVLPLLQKDGTILQDNNYVVNVVAAPTLSKATSTTGTISLPLGYVAAARNTGLDIAKTTLACRTRVLSSIHSQDRVVVHFLQRFHSKPLMSDMTEAPATTADDDAVVSSLLKLRQASMTNARFFLLPIAKFVLGYLRFGSAVVRWAAFRAFLSVLEKASWTPHRSLKQDLNPILHHFVHIVFDESAIEHPGGSPASVPSSEGRRPHAIFDALLREWLLVLQDNSPVEDNVETKRLSLAYSNMLLQLVLKSMAMHSQHLPPPSSAFVGDPSKAIGPALPLVLSSDDEELAEGVLRELIHAVGTNANGLLLQKEVNRSVAYFCRGLFLVARNQVPALVISRYMQWATDNQSDANVLVHLMFPFLRILVDFEFFAVVNGARASSTVSRSRRASSEPLPSRAALPRPSPWLAQLVFERLLCVADEQKEEKIRCDAMRLLRRMFVAQAYNTLHQSPEEQETIALIYYPFVASVAQFTADGKILCSSGTSTLAVAGAPEATDKSQELKKELLICVVHLLSSVSTHFLARFFQQFDGGDLQRYVGARASPSAAFPLSPTGSLLHYRKIVEERKQETASRNRRSILKITGQERRAHVAGEPTEPAGGVAPEQSYDEVRVHACLALVRHIIETFLVDETSLAPGAALWQHLLSPDLVTREGRLSLLDIEMHLNHRRISRQQISMDGFSVAGSVSAALSSSAHSSGRNSGTSAAGSTSAMWSPSPKLIRAGSSNALGGPPTSPGAPRAQTNRSLPRNWGKAYAGGGARRKSSSLSADGGKSVSAGSPPAQPLGAGSVGRSSASQRADDDEPESYELHIRYIHRITAVTSLRTLRTAVDQFEWVLRLIEVPFDCARADRGDNPPEPANVDAVTVEQAYALLGSLIDLVFLLIRRANAIETLSSNFDGDIDESDDEDDDGAEDRDHCFLTDLFEYLESFLARFQKALFACRIADLPLVHDHCRVQTLLSIAATGKMLVVRQHAAKLLCSLAALCYDQTGSFSLVKQPIFKVLCGVFFAAPAAPVAIPTECLREAIDEMRQSAVADDAVTVPFVLQFKELLNGLLTQIKVFELWQVAVASPTQLRDVEEIEEGLYRIMRAISPFWLLEEKKQWLDALLSLHLARRQFAEAACCKLEAVAFTREIVEPEKRSEFLFWEVRELVAARELAERAEWLEQQIAVSELLLARLKEQRRYPEYLETLKYLERVVSQHADVEALQGWGTGTGSHAFYRVTYAGDCVSALVARREFIYKRSRFLSLGEFVGEMKAVLRAKFPACERVDVVPESKPLVGDEPNVIFMRVTSVEPLAALGGGGGGGSSSSSEPTEFKFALPFTLGSSSYGKTREQMKRVTYLSVAQPFPCALSRQVVAARREELRCPIDNSMDDVLKRCMLLQDEVNKELRGRTDLKTLTLVLKGSVDTHVHGGIPEVVESFLAGVARQPQPQQTRDDESLDEAGSAAPGSSSQPTFPPLLDARGAVMPSDESAQKRQQLATLLVRFLKLCWQCLLISREAFRRASAQSSSNLASGAAAAASAPSLLSPASLEGSGASLPPFLSSVSSAAAATTAAAGAKLPTVDDDAGGPLSPLQVEFEKSFAALVELVQRHVPLPPESAGDVALLAQQMQCRRMGSVAPATALAAS